MNVASVAMGADKQQLMKADTQAVAYPGPSIIFCYASCFNQGIKKGMNTTQEEEKLAVQSGYWPLYRYNPLLAQEGTNPFILDPKAPDGSLRDFLSGENRHDLLKRYFPQESKFLRPQMELDIYERHEILRRMAEEEPIRVFMSPSGKTQIGRRQKQETKQCEFKDVSEQAKTDTSVVCHAGQSGT